MIWERGHVPLLSQHTPLYISLKEINFCKCVFYFFIVSFHLRSDLDFNFPGNFMGRWEGPGWKGGQLDLKRFVFDNDSFAFCRQSIFTRPRPHICDKYHKLYSWRKICHVEKFQNLKFRFL